MEDLISIAVNDEVSVNNDGNIALDNLLNVHECKKRAFKAYEGMNKHMRQCINRVNNSNTIIQSSQPTTDYERESVVIDIDLAPLKFRWGNGNVVTNDINKSYEKIVFLRKNMFLLPSGTAGKAYINEIPRLMNAWNNNSPIGNIALKALTFYDGFAVTKPSKSAKIKDHIKVLEPRIELWHKGDIMQLFEAETIQERLETINKSKTITQLSKQFALLMSKGNVNGALKLLTNNMSNGILPLNDETLKLSQKHPDSRDALDDVLLEGDIPEIHPIIFETIDEEMVKQAAIKTNGGSGPSGLDADGWRRIIASNSYGNTNVDLRRAFAEMIKKLCTKKFNQIC